jgi:Cytosine/adenosine deaminases
MEKTLTQVTRAGMISNAPILVDQLEKVSKIIQEVHRRTELNIQKGYGPFYAMILDNEGNYIAGCSNTVVKTQCSLNHAEINTIRAAQEKLKTYDLSSYDLSIYISAEPCIMCAGAIMWSGIKNVYYSVPSEDVERITGFNEGYKPDWLKEFKSMGVNVYGNIESVMGRRVLQNYVNSDCVIYKPKIQV